MNNFKNFVKLTKFELCLWLSSLIIILSTFLVFDRGNFLALIASLIGATSLIFCAKGNPFGQVLIIVFSTLYGIISYMNRYYGELLTYAGMTLPMAILSLVSWIKNPYNNNRSEVKVGQVGFKESLFMLLLTALITLAFYFVLKYFNTANLAVSTFSVATSFLAVYLTFRRSPFFALAYALNDIVLIALWSLALVNDISLVSIVACFATFLANDIYSFINWHKMQKRQKST